jgi:trans-aconitate 2-methyltransferase
VPDNRQHPSDWIAAEVAGEPAFKDLFGDQRPLRAVLPLEEYATLLFRLGFQKQVVRAQVYGHPMGGPEDVVEWVKGALLTWYQERAQGRFPEFLSRYKERLLAELGTGRPYFFTFRRTMLWARR